MLDCDAPGVLGTPGQKRDYLNLGCGSRYCLGWTNVDFTSDSSAVSSHNLIKGIPFKDASFQLVYHSHLLEHFSKECGHHLLLECCRVLKPSGIIRVAVPDLERIAREYLNALADAARGTARDNYDWMMIELYDQTVRQSTGGEMGKYLSKRDIPNRDFVIGRIGRHAFAPPSQRRPGRIVPLLTSATRLSNAFNTRLERAGNLIYRLILGNRFHALDLGRFRLGGEVHLWMYDRYSLSTALHGAGFRDAMARTATDSLLPAWSSYGLDADRDGTIYKPDSLYMEAIKPPPLR
jgi:SAM-dependent methyltransferase